MITKVLLEQEYLSTGKSTRDLANKYNVCQRTIMNWLNIDNIKKTNINGLKIDIPKSNTHCLKMDIMFQKSGKNRID